MLNCTHSLLQLTQLESKIRGTLCNLQSVRNAMRPIQKLPLEILTMIFALSISERKAGYSPRTNDAYKLASVCRRWREIVISFAPFWSDIRVFASDHKMSNIQYTSMCLVRSKGAPITVRMIERPLVDNAHMQRCIDLISDHGPRIRELNLLVQPSTLSAFTLQVPNLEILHVTSSGIDRLDPHREVLPIMFRGQLPRLKHLDLGYFTSWPAGTFNNLTSITLWDPEEENEKMKMHVFLELLDGSPMLESLEMMQHGPISNDDVPPSRTSVLSRLSSLRLRDCHSSLILSHLDLPPSTDITLCNVVSFLAGLQGQAIRAASHMMQICNIFPDDSSRIRSFEGITSLSLFLGDARFDLEKGLTRIVFANKEGGCVEVAEHNFTDIEGDFGNGKLLQPLLNSIPQHHIFSSVRILNVANTAVAEDTELSVHDWKRLLSLPNLNRIAIRFIPIKTLFLALATITEGEERYHDEGEPFCPALETLDIAVALKSPEEIEDFTGPGGLLNLLKWRFETGYSIQVPNLEMFFERDSKGMSRIPSDIDSRTLAMTRFGVKNIITADEDPEPSV